MQISLEGFRVDINERYYFLEQLHSRLMQILVSLRGHYAEEAPLPKGTTSSKGETHFESFYTVAAQNEMEMRGKIANCLKELIEFAEIKN